MDTACVTSTVTHLQQILHVYFYAGKKATWLLLLRILQAFLASAAQVDSILTIVNSRCFLKSLKRYCTDHTDHVLECLDTEEDIGEYIEEISGIVKVEAVRILSKMLLYG